MLYATDLLNAFLWILNFLILPAVTYGSALALGALGVTLVFGILRFANFAHGDLMAFGAMVALICVEFLNQFGVFTYPIPAALLFLPVAMLLSGLLAISLDKAVFSYYRRIKSPPVVMVNGVYWRDVPAQRFDPSHQGPGADAIQRQTKLLR